MHPGQVIYEYRLRCLYHAAKIKLRPIGITCGLNEKQKDFIIKRKLSVLPLVIDLVRRGDEPVLWLDEAVFSTAQAKAYTWMGPH